MWDANGDPICANVATCSDSLPTLAFDGSNFVCQSAANHPTLSASGCNSAAGEVVTGIDANGKALCTNIRGPASAQMCEDGKYLRGLDANNNIICEVFPNSNGSNGQDGKDGISPPALSCMITNRTSKGGAANRVCCDDGYFAMAGSTPQDPKDSALKWVSNKCMEVSAVGRGNLVQLQCCKLGNAEPATSPTNNGM